MVICLSAVSFKTISDSFQKESEFRVEKQKELQDLGMNELVALGDTKTNIKFKVKDGNTWTYDVNMNSKIIKEPIFIYWSDIEQGKNRIEEIKEYQKKQTFELIVDYDAKIMYVLTSKDTAIEFLKRIKREQRADFSLKKFDFKKIKELEKLDSAWGIWRDGEGRIRREASFGQGLEEDIETFEKVTTIYMDYEYGGQFIQIILTKEGRISTNSKDIEDKDMIILFNEIYDVLKES